MSTLKSQIHGLLNDVDCVHFAGGAAGEVYIHVPESSFCKALTTLAGSGFKLVNMFCAENFCGKTGFSLFYMLEKDLEKEVLVLLRHISGGVTSSVEDVFPTACWYEREIRDGFGVTFENAYDTRSLFLHEVYPDGFHPLLKSFKNQAITTKTHVKEEDEYQFRKVSGEEVYQIPVGPVHAGIIEPGHFRFSVIGENIYNLEVRMFYKHRGIEKLAEGKTPKECLQVAEAISGDETVANTVGFCSAIERISSMTVPARAQHLRMILLELERIYSHLGDMAGMVVDVAYPVGASPFYTLREEVLRQNRILTGSRFMRGMIDIGGLKRDVEEKSLNNLTHMLRGFRGVFKGAAESIYATPSVVDRFENTGVIRRELLTPLNITGPAARASGMPCDTRKDHPYCLYDKYMGEPRIEDAGDVMARFKVKHFEVKDSIHLIQALIRDMPTGHVTGHAGICDGFGSSFVEAPRGQNIHWVNVVGGMLDRYAVRTASFCNWHSIEHAVLGNIVPDFPLINKSLNLSYAGTDL